MYSSEKKVIVFTSIYRNENTMHKAIQSILSQTHKNLEFIILVSNDTKEPIMEYAKKDSRIKIVEGTVGISTRSFYELQIELIRQSNCDHIVRIDGDDWCDSRYIEIMLDFADKHGTDIVACGTNFMDTAGTKIIGVRQQNDMVWDTRKTTVKELCRSYRFYGTTWGKLIAADVVLNQNIEKIPESEEYGAYGGDTIWVFNLLSETKKLGICHQALYYYRLPDKNKSNHSNSLKENRLKSDEFLFNYVKNVLIELGCLSNASINYLLYIYATATQDTTELVLRSNMSVKEKSEKLLSIYENHLTHDFLEKENANEMAFIEGNGNRVYGKLFYKTVFEYAAGHMYSNSVFECYLKIFETLNVKCKGKLSLAEFALLMEHKKFLDAFVSEDYNMLFSLLLDELPTFKKNRSEVCLHFLKRLTCSVVLQFTMQDLDFTIRYAYLIKDVQQNNYEAAFNKLHLLFSTPQKLKYAVKLAEFWSNLGAEKENADEFILAKESLVEVLIRVGNLAAALDEYKGLIELGVNDDKMISLSKKLV